jgi:hypothetical protein
LPGAIKRSAKSSNQLFFLFDLYIWAEAFLGMPIIPATDLASAARIIELVGDSVKLICLKGQQNLRVIFVAEAK